MAVEITMPQLSDTMNEGTILSWHKKEGDSVSRGESLAEVATDKADLEIEAFHEGVLLKIHSPVGSTVKVGSVIAVIGAAGETVSSAVTNSVPTPIASATATQPTVIMPQVTTASAAVSATTAMPPDTDLVYLAGGRMKVSPLAKNLASSFGVDLTRVEGTGDGGRIVKKDIERQLGKPVSPDEVDAAVLGKSMGATVSQASVSESSAATPSLTPNLASKDLAAKDQTTVRSFSSETLRESVSPLSKMRQTIASRMVESVNTAPHFYVSGKVNVDDLISLRATLKEHPAYSGITFNHLVIRACALGLRAFPRINCFYRDAALVQPGAINIGIITALEDGLLIPVLKNADQTSVSEIVQETNSMVQRARAGKPKAEDLQGGTFSISNIGKADIENFSAIINPGQGAILAVSSIQTEPVVRDNKLEVGQVMRVTLSVDHRIIDGVAAGQFVSEVKRLLEQPVLLLA